MSSTEIAAIKIGPRQRKSVPPRHIEDLADSFRRLGQIQPIVLTRDLDLIAGECRLKAATHLGWTHIESKFLDEIDDATLRAIELEENVKRLNLDWKDECIAVKEYHEYRLASEPDWNQEKTAEALGYASSKITERLQVAQELLNGNTRVHAAPALSTARGIVVRANLRKDEESVLTLHGGVAIKPVSEEPESILCEDFLTWAPAYTGPKFNLLHCDFPYGIGADKFRQGAADTHGGYDDSEATYWALLNCLDKHIDRLMAPSAHIVFWYSMHYHCATIDFFHRFTDFKIDPFPLVWIKSDNIGIIPDPERGPRRIYETALFGARGDRRIVSPKSNAFYGPSDRTVHMSVKPQAMLTHFLGMFVDASTSILDPTCGSGSALRAADQLGARYAIGLEKNSEFAATAARLLKKGREDAKPGTSP